MSTQLPWKLFDVQNSTAAALCSASVKIFAFNVEKKLTASRAAAFPDAAANKSAATERIAFEYCISIESSGRLD